jgi:hypothetical protein
VWRTGLGHYELIACLAAKFFNGLAALLPKVRLQKVRLQYTLEEQGGEWAADNGTSRKSIE